MDTKINVTPENGVLVVREGEAEKLIQKATIARECNIPSVVDFYLKRSFDKATSHVLVNTKAGSVTLYANDGIDTPDAIITGKLELSPWISKFGINSDKAWLIPELLKLVRLSRMAFKTTADQGNLAASLANVSGQISHEFATADDFKGNTEQKKLTKLTSDIKTSFTLFFAPYIGLDKMDVDVEFQLVVENSTVRALLVSPRLAEILDEEKEKAFDAAIKAMKALPILVS